MLNRCLSTVSRLEVVPYDFLLCIPMSCRLTMFRHLAECFNRFLSIKALEDTFNKTRAIFVIVKHFVDLRFQLLSSSRHTAQISATSKSWTTNYRHVRIQKELAGVLSGADVQIQLLRARAAQWQGAGADEVGNSWHVRRDTVSNYPDQDHHQQSVSSSPRLLQIFQTRARYRN